MRPLRLRYFNTILIFLIASPCLAEGPRFRHKDPFVNREVQNIYQDIRSNQVSSTTLPSGSTFYAQINPTTQQSGAINVASGTLTTLNVSTINGTGVWGFRNRIINGDMRIDQRYAGSATGQFSTATAAGVYTLDRWLVAEDSEGGVKIIQSTLSPPTGYTTFLRSSCTVADTSIGAAQYSVAYQAIEGSNVRDLLLGSANAKRIALSFWVRSSSAGAYCVSFQNSGQARSYVAEYTINAVDTWEKKTITLTGDVTGTWLTTNGVGIYIVYTLASGTNYQTTAGAWAAGNLISTVNQVNWLSSNSARTWDLTGVQFEIGQATDFEYRPVTTELQFCQRYFWKTFDQDVVVATNTGSTNGVISYHVQVAGTTAGYGVSVSFPVVMRVAPTITFYSPQAASTTWYNTADAGNSGASSTAQIGQRSFLARNAQVAGDGAGEVPIIHASASAEL